MVYCVFLDMDRESSDFDCFVISIREHYSTGLMLKHKVVYYLKCKKDHDWNRLGQTNGPSILRKN